MAKYIVALHQIESDRELRHDDFENVSYCNDDIMFFDTIEEAHDRLSKKAELEREDTALYIFKLVKKGTIKHKTVLSWEQEGK